MRDEDIHALVRLRPSVTNVIGIYELLYEQDQELTPYQRMAWETHFSTSALHLAMELTHIIDRILDEQDKGL